ncbi:MAG: 7-cyano-7-deazaguanine synthase, partial [Planctomycetes bacterium]|nr:7-cyano-7-deazaguanine synthase [Planctomycetota bacterium]
VCQGDDIRVYSQMPDKCLGLDLGARQIDMIRIASAVHTADRWVLRRSANNYVRNPAIELEVLDPQFWSRAETMSMLKHCVDFVSGGDDWSFSFCRSHRERHMRHRRLFRGGDRHALVAPYSGGLDSSTGLALRAMQQPDRLIVPVTVRHQMAKAELLRRQFKFMLESRILKKSHFSQYQAGSFIRNQKMKRDRGVQFRETTHRCRALLFMSIAGLVAASFGAEEVEVFESGIGAVNFPLVPSPAGFRTTRSTHPHFLRLLSTLLSHVNESPIKYVLPFAGQTKAEMVAMLKMNNLDELARMSVSCIMHPLKRNGWQQCGYCPACVFRRYALITAGIAEQENSYAVDLFREIDPKTSIPDKAIRCVQAFHDQVSCLHELEFGIVPSCLRRHLRCTGAAETEEQVAEYARVHLKYRREWLRIVAEAQRRNFPWIRQGNSGGVPTGAAS